MTYSHQTDRDLARLKSEAEAEAKRARDKLASLAGRLDAAEAFEEYFRAEFYPWAVALEAFVGFGTPPPEPPP